MLYEPDAHGFSVGLALSGETAVTEQVLKRGKIKHCK